MLRRNMFTANGLVNGAMGTIIGFEWSKGHETLGQQVCPHSIAASLSRALQDSGIMQF